MTAGLSWTAGDPRQPRRYCRARWGGGCWNITDLRGLPDQHMCDRLAGHSTVCVCVCGATAPAPERRPA